MIAFTYPGQGSQEPAMGEPWQDHPSWEIISEISEATGRDIVSLLLKADAEELQLTRNSQLATFSMSMVILDAVTSVGIVADAHAGHSLGEFSALTGSGIFSLKDSAQLVAERGEAMQMASEEQDGTMAAVLGLEDSAVEELCKACESSRVWVANYNAPGQVVIAGTQEGINQVAALAKENGAKKTMPLKVGGAFHTPFMESARERLQKALAVAEFRNPDSPVYANVDATPYDHSDPWQEMLTSQLTSPVRWRLILENMSADGYKTLLELGAGKTLTSMAKRIDGAEFELLAVNMPDDIDALLSALGHPPLKLGQGEHLYATERLVVSPRMGVFKSIDGLDAGIQIEVGALIGHVSDEEIRSPFAGEIMGFLAINEERVNTNQPIAWLRTTG